MPTWVPKQSQELDLPQDPRCIGDMVEDIVDLLDGHFLPGLRVERAAHYAIAALAYHLLNRVAIGLSVLCEELFRVHSSFGVLLRIRTPGSSTVARFVCTRLNKPKVHFHRTLPGCRLARTDK